MKNLILFGLVAGALLYGSRSCTPVSSQFSDRAPRAESVEASNARSWQQAPNALMGMQDAMGSGSGGSARAARNAVQNRLGRTSD